MKSKWTLLSLSLFCGFAACATMGEMADDDEDGEEENEVEIALSEVPKAVQEAAKGAVPGLTLGNEAEVEEENGVKVYEIEGTASGKEYEIEVSADGKVLEVEEDD